MDTSIVNKSEPDLDYDFLNEISKNDDEFKKELLDLFLISLEDNMSKLIKALNEENDDNWNNAAHQLNGSAGIIGAFNLSRVLTYAQSNSKSSTEDKQKILKVINLWVGRVRNAVNEILETLNKTLNA